MEAAMSRYTNMVAIFCSVYKFLNSQSDVVSYNGSILADSNGSTATCFTCVLVFVYL